MNWVKSLLGMDRLLERRISILKQQKEQDINLTKQINNCPVEISLFLLRIREENRKMTEEYNNRSVTDSLNLINLHLNRVEEEQNRLDTMIKTDLCKGLKEIYNSLPSSVNT